MNSTIERMRRGERIRIRPAVIRRKAWIGTGTMMLPHVTAGENTFAAAAAVVAKDMPENPLSRACLQKY